MLPVEPRIAILGGWFLDMVSTKCLTLFDAGGVIAPRNPKHRQIPTSPTLGILGFEVEILNVKPCPIVVSNA